MTSRPSSAASEFYFVAAPQQLSGFTAVTSRPSSAASEALALHLEQHSRLRRLGPLEEEQVELTGVLGRGSFGRVYRGARLP